MALEGFINSGISVPYTSTPSTLTICVWIKKNSNSSFTGFNNIVSRFSIPRNINVSETSGNVLNIATARGSPSNNGQWNSTINPIFPIGTLLHLAIVIKTGDLTNPKLYVNAVEDTIVVINSPSGTINTNSSNWLLFAGGSIYNTGTWNWIAEDYRFYSRELTNKEILTIYNSQGRDDINDSIEFRCKFNENYSGFNANNSAPAIGSGNTLIDYGSQKRNPSQVSGDLYYRESTLSFKKKFN